MANTNIYISHMVWTKRGSVMNLTESNLTEESDNKFLTGQVIVGSLTSGLYWKVFKQAFSTILMYLG